MENKHFYALNTDTGRFAEYEEIVKSYTSVEYAEEKITHAGLGIEIDLDENGNVKKAIVDGEDTNTMIVSNTGAGKTRRVLCQYVLSCIYAGQSFVIHDPKGEVYGFFYKLLKKKDFRIRILNMREPMTGDRFNILQEAATLWKYGEKGRAIEIARKTAETLYLPLESKNDKFWTEAAINLFLCYFTIASELLEPEYVTLGTIYKIHIQGIEEINQRSIMRIYLENHKAEKCYEFGIPSIRAAHETKQSIFSVFTNGLIRVVLNNDIEDMTTNSTFKVKEFVEGKPTALFIITRDESPRTCATLVAAFIENIYTSLIDMAHKKYNNMLPGTVHFILEEFGNIARLENINDMMTASRSRNIRMVLVLQSLCQLYVNYSKELANVLIGNSQNLVYMSSTDMDLVEIISQRCGGYKDPETGEFSRLLSTDRLMHLDKDKGETLFLLGRHYAYISYLPDLSQYKMIEPLEKLNFQARKRLEEVKVEFSEKVREEERQKINQLMEELDKENQKKQSGEVIERTIPVELLKEIDVLIREA